MRSNYPINSTENQMELKNIQEQLMYLLGYDGQPYDNQIDVSGIYDINKSELDTTIRDLMWERIYQFKE